MLRLSAKQGYAFAQSLMAGRTRGEEAFKYAQQAALQNERDGFYELGACYDGDEDYIYDLNKAKENFLRASKLGHVIAMCWLGSLLEDFDPQKWQWWGQAATLGHPRHFNSNFAKQVELFNHGIGNTNVMFVIGQSLQKHVNEKEKTIFNVFDMYIFHVDPAKQAIAFYEVQIKATKAAMHAWTQVGLRFRVVKDIRKLIAALIWDSREEALF